jgi:hypothetical protein
MNAKRLIISPHAEFEMRRRGINRRQVTEVVSEPGQIVPSDRNGKSVNR